MTETADSPKSTPLRKGRRKEVEALELSPDSLVGSYFLRLEDDTTVLWKGLVVGEPQAGVLLLDLEDSLQGMKRCQRLQTLRMMCEPEVGEFRFFDTLEELNLAYADIEALQRSRYA